MSRPIIFISQRAGLVLRLGLDFMRMMRVRIPSVEEGKNFCPSRLIGHPLLLLMTPNVSVINL